MTRPDVSVVLGSLNRRRLLARTIQSVRENGFAGKLEIIVVDGGSHDGTCEWLAHQKDVLTIIQPNYKLKQPDGRLHRAHTWGEFMNMGFRAAQAPWVVMVSDDLILCPNALQSGYDHLNRLAALGEQIGGGAFFWRDYPRSVCYHVKLLPNDVVHVNHGFFNVVALAEVGYADETNFEFYGADGDLSMRLNLAGWKTVPLDNALAEHLTHRINWRGRLLSQKNPSIQADMSTFEERYRNLEYRETAQSKTWMDPRHSARAFWSVAPFTCLQGYLLRYFASKTHL